MADRVSYKQTVLGAPLDRHIRKTLLTTTKIFDQSNCGQEFWYKTAKRLNLREVPVTDTVDKTIRKLVSSPRTAGSSFEQVTTREALMAVNTMKSLGTL